MGLFHNASSWYYMRFGGFGYVRIGSESKWMPVQVLGYRLSLLVHLQQQLQSTLSAFDSMPTDLSVSPCQPFHRD
ncbi:hypothetical protein PHMEG_0002216 [Phytophthora megakarya]|uniref:Uncharacterized protein n=1 Tax=Phytophthora megakarya TaxID=4795 RepID=A0A225WZ43_9STRA|nr:hypothetical protein PHMEG_0002216 [Phytophthora megakarya]